MKITQKRLIEIIKEEIEDNGGMPSTDPLDLVIDEIRYMLKHNPEALKDFLSQSCADLKESAKPDFLDLDDDGDKEEPMKDAAADLDESYSIDSDIDESY
jgi:hypothetical protein